MSEWVQKYIEAKGAEIKKKVEEQLKSTVDCANDSLEAIINGLIEAAKVALPVNLLDILAKGGYVYAKEGKFEENWSEVYLRIGGNELIHGQHQLVSGKYRVVLVIERLPP